MDEVQTRSLEAARIKTQSLLRHQDEHSALELVETFCTLLLDRFAVLVESKVCAEGLEEAVATVIWSAPFLQSSVPELMTVECFAIETPGFSF